ncbi:MAG: lactonase family protein [Gammaproteobacteria bacterium]|nr:lactonase family protein [Gammaproteobacteria bacterium]
MHYYRFILNIACFIITLFFIAGCSSSNSDILVSTQLNIQASLPKGGSTASGQPIKSFKTKGELSAYIRINGLEPAGDQFRKMVMVEDKAIYPTQNIQPGTYSIDIEFRYQTEEYGSVTLLAVTKTVTISEGGTTLNFNEESYQDQYLDDDKDSASNYYELRLGSNPRDEDKIDPETIAFPAGGDSGGYWGQQSVVLDCTDLGGSGCDKTYYTTDKSDPKTSPTRTEYQDNILITETTTLTFYSIDRAENEETPSKKAEYIINNESNPPTTILTPPPGTFNRLVKVSKDCIDQGGSGCGDMYYTKDGSDPKVETNPSRIKYSTTITIADTTILKFYSVDKAGNEEATQEVEYKIAITAALSRSIKSPTKPHIVAETYSANLGNTEASFSVVHPSGSFAYRIENNKVLGFQLKPASTTPILELTTPHPPTSIALHPTGEFAYIASNNRGSSRVTAFEINKKTGDWNKVAAPVYHLSINAEVITITPDGHFLYLLSDQNIMTYNINPKTGEITESANQHTVLTSIPSAALISQSGEQLYIRYQALDMIEKYTIDSQTGALDGPIKQLPVNSKTTPKTMLILGQNFYLIDTHYPLFTKTVGNYVEIFW